MMKRNFILGFFCIFLIGCSGQTIVENRYNPYSGSNGVELEFLEGAPHDEIFENSYVPIGVRVENEGASDAQGVIVFTIPRTLFDYEIEEFDIDLEGRTIYNSQGGVGVFSLPVHSRGLDIQQEIQTVTVSASTCYDYTTTFSDEVCIDTDYQQVDFTDKSCEIRDLNGGSQGAPVGVTQVDVTMIPHPDQDKVIPELRVTIRNIGSGTVLNEQAVPAHCSGGSRNVENLFNVVRVERAQLSNLYPLDCEGLQLRLDEREEASFSCAFPEGIEVVQGSFNTPLVIQLSYGYMETINTDITITKKVR